MKKLTSIFLVLIMLLTLAPANIMAVKPSFSDVSDSDYYAQAAEALGQLEILSGYPDGTFGADKTITRAEMAAVVCRMIDKEADAKKANGKTAFDDVKSNHWASGYINIASKEGIINGDGDGKFRPEDKVKYEEAIKMVICALGYDSEVKMDSSDWSKGYLKVAKDKGISDKLKGEKGKASTRGDVAVMSYNGLAADLAKPKTSLNGGTYTGTRRVKLSTATKGAEIYYTTDGSTPTTNSTKYTDEIRVANSCTLKAITVKDGVLASDVLTLDYTIYRTSGGVNRPATTVSNISRGEWIKMLVESYGYPQSTGESEIIYTDLADSTYKNAVETAIVYGVLRPETSGTFNPDSAATREFVAESAVHCLGYEPLVPIVCNDTSEISDPKAAQQAAELGMFSLENNNFYPDKEVTKPEAQRILGIIEEVVNSTDSTEPGEGFVFADGVTVLPDGSSWPASSARSNLLTVPQGENIPEVGDIVVFGKEKAIKVEEVIQAQDGTTQIRYSSPQLHEFLDSIDIGGEAYLDFSQFEPAEGVTVSSGATTDSIQTMGFGDDAFDVPNTELDVNGEISFSGDIDLGDNWAIGYAFNLAIPTVAYKFDIDFDWGIFNDEPLVNIKNAYVKIKEDANVHFEFGQGIDTGDDEFDDSIYDDIFEREIQLGTVPLVGIDGLCVEIELDLVLKASGKFELDYNLIGTLGCQVLNNRLRNISALTASASYGLSAEVSAGNKLGLEAEVFGEDLLDFAFEGGAKADGSVHVRSTGMVCMDAAAYCYAELSALENCKLDDWWDIGLVFNIWDSNNSPIKINGHWENMQKVDDCAFNEEGTISGMVANADNRNQYISGATINILKHDTLVTEKKVYSDNMGKYTAQIPANSYLVQISAAGYIPFESLETVAPNQTVYLETYLLVEGDENSNETGTISGTIKNSVTGAGVSGAKLTIRKGWNKTTGEIVDTKYTSSSGTYSATLPLGNYTISMECDGYLSNHFNVAVTRNGNPNAHGTLSPNKNNELGTGEVRIVLTWGATPSDLDSHLVGPASDGGRFHTYFSDKTYSAGSVRYADLDLDDTSSYGPETTTIYIQNNTGKYRYYVHNYSDRYSTSSTRMSNSGAKVQVYSQNELVATYHVPTNVTGTLWSVFEYDSETKTIIPLNTMSNQSSPGNVGIQLFGINDGMEEYPDDIELIMEDIEKSEK